LGAVAVLVVAIGTVGYNLKIWRNDPAETVSEPKLVQPDAKQIDPGQNSAVPKPTPSLAKEIMTKTADIKLLLIPAGKFMMGASESDPNATEPEKPSHEVTISRSFYLGRTEVTVGQFRKFVDSTNYATISERDGWGGWGFDDNRNFVQAPQFSWRNTGFDQTDEHPVTNVAWGDARAFVEWLSKEEGRLIRLPTEAEWEYACRAGTTTIWSGTDDETNALESAWTSENSAKQAHAVAQKKPNAFGLFDMHGNIQEYCGDVYEESFYVGSASKDPVNLNPQVFLKVLRGGAWWHPSLMARSASRDKIDPSKRFFCWGFRIASSLTPQEREIQPN
jgi:formylglycine-generating enzyme required for sulfatase activity